MKHRESIPHHEAKTDHTIPGACQNPRQPSWQSCLLLLLPWPQLLFCMLNALDLLLAGLACASAALMHALMALEVEALLPQWNGAPSGLSAELLCICCPASLPPLQRSARSPWAALWRPTAFCIMPVRSSVSVAAVAVHCTPQCRSSPSLGLLSPTHSRPRTRPPTPFLAMMPGYGMVRMDADADAGLHVYKYKGSCVCFKQFMRRDLKKACACCRLFPCAAASDHPAQGGHRH